MIHVPTWLDRPDSAVEMRRAHSRDPQHIFLNYYWAMILMVFEAFDEQG